MRLTALVLCLPLPITGCIGAGTMRGIAPDAGLEARYALPSDSVLTALDTALRRRGLRVEEETRVDSTTTMVIASKGANLFGNGEFVRVLVQRSPDVPAASARVVARSRHMLDPSGRADRTAPRLLQALDGALGASAIGPQPGDRVRGRWEGERGAYVTGAAVTGPGGTLRLSPDANAAAEPIPMAALTDVAVFRGSYSHRLEGAMIGILVGLVAGACVGYGTESRDEYRGMAAVAGAALGGGAGLVLGIVGGQLIRTEVWSPTGPHR